MRLSLVWCVSLLCGEALSCVARPSLGEALLRGGALFCGEALSCVVRLSLVWSGSSKLALALGPEA